MSHQTEAKFSQIFINEFRTCMLQCFLDYIHVVHRRKYSERCTEYVQYCTMYLLVTASSPQPPPATQVPENLLPEPLFL